MPGIIFQKILYGAIATDVIKLKDAFDKERKGEWIWDRFSIHQEKF